MGIRRSYGKNKKRNRPIDATTVEREDILRRAANVRSRFDGTPRAAQPVPRKDAVRCQANLGALCADRRVLLPKSEALATDALVKPPRATGTRFV